VDIAKVEQAMRWRKLRWVLAGLAVALVALLSAGEILLHPPPNRVTKTNCDRVLRSMTLAEVEAILGPPGDYRTGRGTTRTFVNTWDANWPPVDDSPARSQGIEWPRYGQVVWISDSAYACIGFNGHALVANIYSLDRQITDAPLDRLLWRAKRQWRHWFP
jgi:hypothetical protein